MRWQFGARLAVVGAFFASPLLAAGHAAAQEAAPVPIPAQQLAPPGLLPIAVFPEDPGLRFELQLPDTRRPVALCQGPCTAYLPPGRYRFFVHPTNGTRAGGRTVEIEAPSVVLLKPRTHGHYETGLTLGIVGSALIFISTLTLLSTADGRDDHDDLIAVSLLGFVTGAVLTPIGWVSFGRSLRPAVDVQRMGS
jgi:hypothetical protein